MRKIKLIGIGLLLVFAVSAQKIKQIGNELGMQYEELGNIALGTNLKLKELYRIDKDLKILESLGEPVKMSYKDHIAYEQWHYEFEDLHISLINRNGYIQVESVTFLPSASSQFRIGEHKLNSDTKIKEIASFNSRVKGVDDMEMKVFITSMEVSRYPDISLTITKDDKGKRIKKINIQFDTM